MRSDLGFTSTVPILFCPLEPIQNPKEFQEL